MTIHHTRPIQKRMTIFAAVGMKFSLFETNLGMPYIYLIYLAYSSRFTEDMRRRGARQLLLPDYKALQL